MIHQDSVTANLHQLTSNLVHLLPKPVLWFQLSWGDLIIITLIMLMLRLNLQGFQLGLNLNLYPDTTLIRSNDDDEMDHILELFHCEHDEDYLDIDMQMLQS